MSALSAAASDEDGDIISALREKLGRAHALCRIRLDRIRELEAQLYAVGAGGVGKMAPSPAVKQSLTDEQPQVEQKPVAWAIFVDSCNARMWTTFQPHIQKLADAEGLAVTPLYTHQARKFP